MEKLELIEQRSETQILFRKKGNLVWRKPGPWMRRHFSKMSAQQADILTNKADQPGYFLNFGPFSLQQRDIENFYRDVHALVERYKAIAYQQSIGSTDDERSPVSWNFMAMPDVIEISPSDIPNI